jgi:large subunit ribosomal protein L2
MKFILKNLKKKLLQGKQKINGRNNSGKTTVYHRGGGCKRCYRFVDFTKFV